MARETDGLDRFCEREYGRLVGALDLYVGDLHTAEELAQEALLRAAARWDSVSALESPGGWARRVAMNLAASWFRRKQAERRALRIVGSTDEPASGADGADRASVRAALAQLPARQRQALVLRYYLDLPAAEAAAAMGATPSAIRALTKRAVAALRVEFGADRGEREGADDV